MVTPSMLSFEDKRLIWGPRLSSPNRPSLQAHQHLLGPLCCPHPSGVGVGTQDTVTLTSFSPETSG